MLVRFCFFLPCQAAPGCPDEADTQLVVDSYPTPSPSLSPVQPTTLFSPKGVLTRGKSNVDLLHKGSKIDNVSFHMGEEGAEEEEVTSDECVEVISNFQDNDTLQILSDDDCAMSPKVKGLANKAMPALALPPDQVPERTSGGLWGNDALSPNNEGEKMTDSVRGAVVCGGGSPAVETQLMASQVMDSQVYEQGLDSMMDSQRIDDSQPEVSPVNAKALDTQNDQNHHVEEKDVDKKRARLTEELEEKMMSDPEGKEPEKNSFKAGAIAYMFIPSYYCFKSHMFDIQLHCKA